MNREHFRELDFELAYLALLTQAGLKPLSRWESGFDEKTVKNLHALGLKTRVIERRVQNGREARELVFGRSDACLGQYAARFDHTAILRDGPSARAEGLWFGYPACCVESFIGPKRAPASRPADVVSLGLPAVRDHSAPACAISAGLPAVPPS